MSREVLFRIVFDDAVLLKSIFSALRELVDEAIIYFDGDGFGFEAFDEHRIAFIRFSFGYESALDYTFHGKKEDRDYLFGILTKDVNRVFNAASKGDFIALSLSRDLSEESERFYFGIEFYRNEDGHSYAHRSFYLNVFDPVEGRTKFGKLDHNVAVMFSPADIVWSIVYGASQLDWRGDITINADYSGRKLVFSSINENGDAFEYAVNLDRDKYVAEWSIKDDSTSMYYLPYMRKITKISKKARVAFLGYSTERPLEVRYLFDGGLELFYLLAPRLM